MNLMILAGPISVLLFIFGLMYYLNKKKSFKKSFFWKGVLAWIIVLFAKTIFNFLTNPLLSVVSEQTNVYTLLSFIFNGVRSGLIELGIIFLLIKKLKKKRFNESISYGFGFSFIGLLFTALTTIIFLLALSSPVILNGLEDSERSLVNNMLNNGSVISLVPWLTQPFSLMINLFAIALVFNYFKSKDSLVFWTAVIYKGLVSAPQAIILPLINEGNNIAYYFLSAYIVLMGLGGLYGLKQLKEE